jgi:hypothetical protein
MLQAMRLHWAAGNVVDAVDCAAKAAPYVHPRLVAAAVAVRLPSEMSDEELAAAIDDAEQAAAALARPEKLPSGAGGNGIETSRYDWEKARAAKSTSSAR